MRDVESGCLLSPSKNALDVPFSMKDGDDLERDGVVAVDDHVVTIPSDRPETNGAGCQVGAEMTAQRAVGEEGTCVVNRLFDTVGCVFIVFRDVGPDLKYVGFG